MNKKVWFHLYVEYKTKGNKKEAKQNKTPKTETTDRWLQTGGEWGMATLVKGLNVQWGIKTRLLKVSILQCLQTSKNNVVHFKHITL